MKSVFIVYLLKKSFNTVGYRTHDVPISLLSSAALSDSATLRLVNGLVSSVVIFCAVFSSVVGQ